MLARIPAFLLIVACLSGCTSVWVYQDYDPNADFSAYKTFAWHPDPKEKTGDLRIDNPLLHERIQDAVERTLGAKGYEQVAEGEPDCYVTYHLSLRTRLDVRTIDRGSRYHYYRPRRRDDFDVEVSEYDEGTLIIDIVDRVQNQLVWRGWGTRMLQEYPTPEQSISRINQAVAKILEQFPPGKK